MEILFRMIQKIFQSIKKSIENKQKKTTTPPKVVEENSISAIKVKQKPKDDSVPFAYTGYTESFVSKEKKKIPSKEKQNPRHVIRTYDPQTHQMNTAITEYNPYTFEERKVEINHSVETVEDYQKRLEEEIRIKLNSKMATSSLFSHGVDVDRARKIIKKQK